MAGRYNIQFVADTSQSDAKIKQQIKYLQDLERNVRRMDTSFKYAEQADLDFVKSLGQMQSHAMTAKGRVSELNNGINEMRIFYNRMTQEERKAPMGQYMTQSIKEASVTLRQYKAELASVNGSAGVSGLGGKMGLLMRGNLASFAAYEGIMLASRGMRDMVKTNMDFEQASANLAAILGTTRGKIQDMTTDAVEMSKAYRYSATEVLNLQTILARFGFSKAEVDASTASIIQLATATGSDLEKAANLTASTLRAFNLSATESGRVASTLAVATTKSALNMDMLATTLPYVSNIAKTFNLSLEDTVALVGTLADSGFKASQQGTGLRNILGKLASSSSKLSKALGSDVHSLEDMQKAFIKLREEGISTAEIFDLTDQRVAAAFARLLTGAENLTILRDKITDVREEMQKMIDEQLSTTATEFDKLSHSWDAFSISLSDTMGPLGSVAKALKEVVDLATKFNTLRWGNAFQLGAIFSDPDEKYDKALVDRMVGAYGDKPTDADPKKQQQLQQEKFDYVTERENQRMELDVKRLEDLVKVRTEYQNSIFNTTLGRKNPLIHFGLGVPKEDKESLEEWTRILGYDPSDTIRMGKEIAELQKAINGSEQIKAHYKPDDVNPFGNGRGVGGEGVKAGDRKDLVDRYNRDLWNYTEQGIENWLKTFKEQVAKADPNSEWFRSYQGQGVDMRSLQSLFGVAKQYGMDDVLGDLRGQFDKIAENAEDVTKEAWTEIVEKINEKLKTEGKPEIELDFTTGNIKNKSQTVTREDMRILNGLMAIARGNKIGYDKVGIGGQKDRIKNGEIIPNSEYEDIAKNLNDELKKRGVTWYIDIDFETGTIERLKTRIQEVMEAIGSGTNGLKSFVGAFDSVKKAGESMVETLQGDADGWDKMMSVFNAAMAPMEAMVTIYESINALKAMSATLSAKETVAKIADTAATTAHTVAETADAGASGESASASAAEGIAKGVKSVSWIPIVGPILAVAAAASIAAAIAAGNRKTEYHAEGGFVGGGPFVPRGSDTVPAMLTPGELVLNRAQQNTLAAQLVAPQWGGGDMTLRTEISGENLAIVLDNNNRRRGRSKTVR